MAGDVLRTAFEVSLDWSGPRHWSATVASCRRCKTGTKSRDARGAIHQSCAEFELAEHLSTQLTTERYGPLDEGLLAEQPRGGTR